MIFGFGFRSASVQTHAVMKTTESEVDHDRLIDVSLLKLSNLQCMGKIRTERQILFVLEVLERALFSKSLKINGDNCKFYMFKHFYLFNF